MFIAKSESLTRFDPVGRCIYCGAGGEAATLSDEHVIALSLAGRMVLPKASCAACSKVTASYEGYCARHIFGEARVKMGFPTRRPKQRPTEFEVLESYAPDPRTAPKLMVPAADYPGILFLLNMEPAGILMGRGKLAPTPMSVYVREVVPNSAKKFKVYREQDPIRFGRLLAKSALGLAVGAVGLDGFVATDLQNVVLGREQDPFYWVGGTTAQMASFPSSSTTAPVIHRVCVFTKVLVGVPNLLVQIQLFAKLDAPIYTVVAGPLTMAGLARTPTTAGLRRRHWMIRLP